MAYTTINKSSLHMNTKLYTGNASTHAITGVGFQPDLVWIKNRDTTNAHVWQDAVRGADKTIYSNATNTQDTGSTNVGSFDSDGFTLGSNGGTNGSGNNIVSWNWKAGGTGSANTAGDINSTVSVNLTSKFSIVKWTGTGSVASIGHGLGVAPKLIIVKRLNGGNEAWPVDCRAVSGTMYLNETGSLQSYGNSTPFPSDAPTSTKFYVGSANNGNASGSDFIAYCFAEVNGFSKIGEYRGNETNDNAFIYTGFKPSFILIKNYHGTDNWQLFDNKRIGYNVDNNRLNPNESGAENTNDEIDILSNGFKIRTGSSQALGHNGHKYIFMAFGQSLVGSNNVPCTAR